MECFENLNDVKLDNTAVTVGKFDGLHLGHGRLLKQLKDVSGDRRTAVLAFSEKPLDVINRMKSERLMTESEKRFFCETHRIDYYVSLPLTEDFLNLSPEAFIKDVLIDRLGMTMIVCGEDFTFGRFGAGDTALLKKMSTYYGYEVVTVKKERYNNKDICSTAIRERIASGDLESAAAMLGRPYSIFGRVSEGKRLGQKIEMPTANLIPEEDKILPPRGVYRTVLVHEGRLFRSVTNIGFNPTVDCDRKIKIETHILNGGENLYGQVIEVRFLNFMRAEKKFDSVDELRGQMEKDVTSARLQFMKEEKG